MTVMVAVRQLLKVEGRDVHDVADAVMQALIDSIGEDLRVNRLEPVS